MPGDLGGDWGVIGALVPSSLDWAIFPNTVGRNRKLSPGITRRHTNCLLSTKSNYPTTLRAYRLAIEETRFRGNPHAKAASCNRGRAMRESNQYRQLQTKYSYREALSPIKPTCDVCASRTPPGTAGGLTSQIGAAISQTQP